MPEPTSCHERTEPREIRQNAASGDKNALSVAPEESPKRDPVPETLVATQSEDDDCGEVKARERSCECPGPVGPEAIGKPVPLDYWTPLAGLTGTRPAVEGHSIARYSPAEWRSHNEKFSRDAADGIRAATLAVSDANRCVERVYARTDQDLLYNDLRLSARAAVIFDWSTELQRGIRELAAEIRLLEGERARAQRCANALRLVETIARDARSLRGLREEPDLVRDEVDEELIRELALCAEIGDLFTRCADQLRRHSRELKDAKQRLECDWSGKAAAYEIDTAARGLRHDSSTVLWKEGSVRIPSEQSSGSDYERICEEIVDQGETALRRSRALRAEMSAIFGRAAKDLRRQADRVELALADNINRTVQLIRRLEDDLLKCLKTLADTEASVDDVRGAAKRLDGAMKCAQTRLDDRLRREGPENCRDVPQSELIEEVKTLSTNASAMLGRMKGVNDSTEALVAARRAIEREIVVKRKTLSVDRERCQLMRKSFYPSVQALAGFP